MAAKKRCNELLNAETETSTIQLPFLVTFKSDSYTTMNLLEHKTREFDIRVIADYGKTEMSIFMMINRTEEHSNNLQDMEKLCQNYQEDLYNHRSNLSRGISNEGEEESQALRISSPTVLLGMESSDESS